MATYAPVRFDMRAMRVFVLRHVDVFLAVHTAVQPNNCASCRLCKLGVSTFEIFTAMTEVQIFSKCLDKILAGRVTYTGTSLQSS